MSTPLACVPDELGRLVLHASLDTPAGAAEAWQRCRTHPALADEAAPNEARRLLPLVWRNLPGEVLGEADEARLRARYDAVHRANEAHAALAARWISLLELGGVPSLVLKGLPLAVRDYADLGVRPMADVDLLVRREDADRALDLLEGAGWRDGGGSARAVVRRVHHGSGMVSDGTSSLDLHWSLSGFLDDRDDQHADERGFWSRAERIPLADRSASTLDRTDTLLHVCLHGLWSGSGATTRWVADAVTVLRAAEASDGPGIDGDRLARVAERHHVGALLAAALDHVESEYGAPIPADLVARLGRQPESRRVRHRQRVVTAAPEEGPVIDGLAHLRAYWTYTRWAWSDRDALRTLPTFLTTLWGLDHPRQLPAAVVQRSWGRLRGRRGAAPPGGQRDRGGRPSNASKQPSKVGTRSSWGKTRE